MIRSYLLNAKTSYSPRYTIAVPNNPNRACYVVNSFFEAQFFAAIGYEVQMLIWNAGSYVYSTTL